MSEKERFLKALNIIMEHEGGYSNDKNDPGGVTKYGISLRYLKDQGIDIDGDHDSDCDDIKNMTKQNASDIYKKYWWDKYKYNAIQNLTVATKIFDLSVNMGASAAHKIVQNAINDLITKPIAVDGILGNKTRDFLNSLPEEDLMDNIRSLAAKRYEYIAAKNPKLKVFLKGWLHRADW